MRRRPFQKLEGEYLFETRRIARVVEEGPLVVVVVVVGMTA